MRSKTNLPIAEQYAVDISTGQLLASDIIATIAGKHRAELSHVGDPQFPFYFDAGAAHRALSLLEPLRLSPIEHFVCWRLFGWKKSDGTRRFDATEF
jgi:hypothetical protein